MIESLYRFAEPAVSVDNVLLTFTLTLLIGLAIGYYIHAVRHSLVQSAVSFVIFEVVCLLIYFAVREQVSQYRYKVIDSTMVMLDASSEHCGSRNTIIQNWREGIEAIKDCPTSVGYYISTAYFLIAENDWLSAATLLEFGMDNITQSPPPITICSLLSRCYEHLPNRARVDLNCNKFYEF